MSMFYELMMRKKGIPKNYELVEYIESTGTQYIDTGIVPTMDISFKLVASKVGSFVDNNIFGSRKASGATTDLLGILTDGSSAGGPFISLCNSGLSFTSCRISYDNDFHTYSVDGNTLKIDDVKTVEHSPVDYSTNDLPMYLFGLNNRGVAQLSAQKVKSLQISDNNRLVRNFIPVYDTLTNKYGMWESVQRKFYGNDGTGDFKGSIVGYTVVGSPSIVDGVVSGFSSSDYLKINVPNAINYNVFELNIKFKTTDSSVYQRLIWNLNNLLFVMAGGNLSLNFYNTSSNWTSRNAGAIQNNTWYWYKIEFDIVNKTMTADRSTDGINFTNVLSSQNINNIYSNIKITTNGIIFCDQNNSGNITLDLNNTNIKVNNKLWFNGQEA